MTMINAHNEYKIITLEETLSIIVINIIYFHYSPVQGAIKTAKVTNQNDNIYN